MTQFLGSHPNCGGLFLVSDDPHKIVKVIIEPDHYAWNETVRRGWLAETGLTDSDTARLRQGLRNFTFEEVFQFNGKQFFSLGVGPDGFKQIRSVDNPDVYVKAIV